MKRSATTARAWGRGIVLGVFALALALAAVVGLERPAAAATNGPLVGVQFHGTWGDYTDASRAMVLDTLKANGAGTVRIDVSWRMLEPNKSGTFDAWGLSVVDNAIRQAQSRGLRPLVTLWMAPQWANGSTDERVPPTSSTGLNGLKSVTKRLAARYAGVVDAWEVWNEPNDTNFMRGADPKVYAKVLTYAYSGFKSGSAATPVVFGGPSYVDDEWVRTALAAGARGKYDVMSVHPYQGVADEAPDLPDNGTKWRMNHLPALISAMAAYGDGAKPIWFTEFGWRVAQTSTTAANWERGVTATQQADYLNRTIQLVRSKYPQVARIYWYCDRVSSTDVNNSGYGMVFPDGSVTPALAGLKGFLAAPAA